MESFDLAEFLPRERQTPFEVWREDFPDWTVAEYGVSEDTRDPPVKIETERGTHDLVDSWAIWTYIPGDSVDRLAGADDILSVFSDIIDETYSNMRDAALNDFVTELRERVGDDVPYEPRKWIKCAISRIAMQPFRGMIPDPQKIFSSDVEFGEQQPVSTGIESVIVEKIVSNPEGRLARDRVEYEIADPDRLFENAYPDSTLILRKILDENLEPASVDYRVEYDWGYPDHETVGIIVGLYIRPAQRLRTQQLPLKKIV